MTPLAVVDAQTLVDAIGLGAVSDLRAAADAGLGSGAVVELLDGRLGAEAEGIFAEAAAAARAVLAKTTIMDVVDRENQAAGATMYYI